MKTSGFAPSLQTELLDAWEGEGNSWRVSFHTWLMTMASSPRGTLQEAAKNLLALGGYGAVLERPNTLVGYWYFVWPNGRREEQYRVTVDLAEYERAVKQIKRRRSTMKEKDALLYWLFKPKEATVATS